MDLLALGLSAFFGLVPMLVYSLGIRAFDRFEKEPWPLLAATFLWGAVVAAAGAFLLNTVLGLGFFLVTADEQTSELLSGVLAAPLVEETWKGLAVLAVFLFSRREFDSVLDGILYASMAGFGFAATENLYYIFSLGYLESGFGGLFLLVFIRVVLVAFQHAFYTAFTGIGLAVSRLGRAPAARVGAPFLGFSAAVLTHSVHNFLAGGGEALTLVAVSAFDWLGVLGMLVFVIYLVGRERRIMARYLLEEVEAGLLSGEEYQIACSPLRQWSARWSALGRGRWTHTSRWLDLCGELAFKKYQLHRLGEEAGNSAEVERLRGQLRKVKAA